MTANINPADCKKTFNINATESGSYYSLPALATQLGVSLARLPVSLRIVLESVLRNCDGQRITTSHIAALANWQPTAAREDEVPFVVSRVILQDLTGVPLLADLAAMRDAAQKNKINPSKVKPLVPVDLVVDHSIHVDHYATGEAAQLNMEIEFQRNRERYQFLKWGMHAFDGFRVIPPGIGICHQVNLEYLASGVMHKDGVYYPDTLVGADSHTTMIGGIGVVGWGVGGIEAEAAMLGQPINMLMPDVVGVHLKNSLPVGTTATDLVLAVTELLRQTKVVGKFVEFFGDGAQNLPVPDRATISNMAPEYGATIGFFATDDKTLAYYRQTGRDERLLATVQAYYETQELFGIPAAGQCDYSQVVELDLAKVASAVAGPARPQDRILLRDLQSTVRTLMHKPKSDGGYEQPADALQKRYETQDDGIDVGSGDVLIAAITSCTNTSNPGVLLAAGLIAKKAVELGIRPHARVKTSFAPGSRVVADYLQRAGLLQHLETLGFNIVGYGCTTCIGNSGALSPAIDEVVEAESLIGAAVLSGNRNFEARVHQSLRANFLASPPLVVAFALAGRVDVDLTREPLATSKDGKPVYLKDLWPTPDAIAELMQTATDPTSYRKLYAAGFEDEVPLWRSIDAGGSECYAWDAESTYIQPPPFFDATPTVANISGARALAIFGNSVTTDHISPAGAIKASAPAGEFLKSRNIGVREFNSYGARRGNHNIMMRGTFANVRIRNLMMGGREGGLTRHQPSGEEMSIYDAAVRYAQSNTPLVIFAGEEYGTGSSRDWAAKGTLLLGVRMVVARSFERIHRSNLIGMGVLPCQFTGEDSAESLGLDGSEQFSCAGLESGLTPKQEITLIITRANGEELRRPILVRVDTPTEVAYLNSGGILPHALAHLAA